MTPADRREQAEKIIARCRYLAQFTEEPGQIRRTFLSSAMRECMQAVEGWMQAAGLTVRTDAAGNLRGRYPGTDLPSPCLMIGSHLDTVPNGGAFDGMLGVVMGLALVEALHGEKLPFALEVTGFSDEEGVRFHLPFIGSRAMVGRTDGQMLAVKDDAGISLAEALESFGLNPVKIKDCLVEDDVAGFLEFHIEQGNLLESEGQSLGVVQAVAGQSRAEITFYGRANHAGTTPMRLRHDAVAAAAEWVGEVERVALGTPGLVATVGYFDSHPGAGNVIAGRARASLDVRHADDRVRHQAVNHLLSGAGAISARRGLTVDRKMLMDQAAVMMDSRMCAMAAEAIREVGVTPLAMISGAGHDAMVLQERVASTMIFLRSPGGLSHHPEESVRLEDVENALGAGLAFLHQTFKPAGKPADKRGDKEQSV
jgi:allantoate deiminase